MGNVSLPIGATNSGTNDWSDVHGEDQAIVDVVNGGIDNTNLSGSAGITDANLASPNNSAYKTLYFSDGLLGTDAAAGTYMLGTSRSDSDSGAYAVMVTSAYALSLSAVATEHARPLKLFYFDNDDFTVGSKTQKLRVRAQVAANATQPAITFTVGLYPVTVAGGADAITYTLGTVVSGSTVAFASPSASTITQGNSGDFTIPSDGAYALGVVTSAQITNNSVAHVFGYVQTRNV